MDFIEGDIYHDGRVYWRLSTKWYILHDNYCRKISEQFLNNLKESKRLISMNDQIQLPIPWLWSKKDKTENGDPAAGEQVNANKKKCRKRQSKENVNVSTHAGSVQKPEKKKKVDHEFIYNCKYNDKPGYFVGDHLTEGNIELFDILFTKSNAKGEPSHFYLYHVKHGFDTAARVGCAQVLDAMNIGAGALNSQNDSHLKNFYDHVWTKKEYADKPIDSIPFVFRNLYNFKKVFEKKKSTYIYAVQTNKNLQNSKDFTDLSILFKPHKIRESKRNLHLEKQILTNVLPEDLSCFFKKYIDNGEKVCKEFAKEFGEPKLSQKEVCKRITKLLVDEGYVDAIQNKVNPKLLYATKKDFTRNFQESNQNNWIFEKKLYLPLYNVLGAYRTLFRSVAAKMHVNRLIEMAKVNDIAFKICEILGGKAESHKNGIEQTQTESTPNNTSGISVSDNVALSSADESDLFKKPFNQPSTSSGITQNSQFSDTFTSANSSLQEQQNPSQDSAYGSDLSNTHDTSTTAKKKTQRKRRASSTPSTERKPRKIQKKQSSTNQDTELN